MALSNKSVMVRIQWLHHAGTSTLPREKWHVSWDTCAKTAHGITIHISSKLEMTQDDR